MKNKPCCASCGQCKTCGESLEDGGYEWRKKRYCSEGCVRAAGYRDNPQLPSEDELKARLDGPGFPEMEIPRGQAVLFAKKYRRDLPKLGWDVDLFTATNTDRNGWPHPVTLQLSNKSGHYFLTRHWGARSNPARSTPPRYAVYVGKKVLRRFHDERNALLFAEQNHAHVWDNVRAARVNPTSGTAIAIGGALTILAVAFVRKILSP